MDAIRFHSAWRALGGHTPGPLQVLFLTALALHGPQDLPPHRPSFGSPRVRRRRCGKLILRCSDYLGTISLRWFLALGRADAYQHMVPSWPVALKVQDGHPPGWCCSTAEGDGKQEASCSLAAESCFPLSDNVCGGLASVGSMSKSAVGCTARLSTVISMALSDGA